MAKTTFAALMQIPSVWLNKVFAHRHDGLDADGSAPINYAADTGAADAYAIALAPALTAHIVGMPIVFVPAHTNTGASIIAINGLAAAAIRKNGATVLAAGDLVANHVVCIVWDGTNYQFINPNASSSFPAISETVFAADAEKTIAGLSPGKRYKIILNLIQNTSNGKPFIQFNSDTGANYNYEFGGWQGAGTANPGGANGETSIPLAATTNVVKAASWFSGEFLLQTKYGADTTVLVNGQTHYLNESATTEHINHVGGNYDGGVALSSITIGTTVGTLSGKVTIYEFS